MILILHGEFSPNQFSGPKTTWSTVGSGTWNSLTRPECRVRFRSFWRERVPSTMPWDIFLLMVGCSCSTLESSRNLYVLVCACEHVSRIWLRAHLFSGCRGC